MPRPDDGRPEGGRNGLSRITRGSDGRPKQRPWRESPDVLGRVEQVYRLHVQGFSIREISEVLDVPRSTVGEDVCRGRQLALEASRRSVDELRAEAITRIALGQRFAYAQLQTDGSPAWLACWTQLERLRVQVEGTKRPELPPAPDEGAVTVADMVILVRQHEADARRAARQAEAEDRRAGRQAEAEDR